MAFVCLRNFQCPTRICRRCVDVAQSLRPISRDRPARRDVNRNVPQTAAIRNPDKLVSIYPSGRASGCADRGRARLSDCGTAQFLEQGGQISGLYESLVME